MIRILVDSSSDYLMEEIKEKNLEIAPIGIVIGNETYFDGQNLERDHFYEILKESEAFPQTSQPSPQEFLDIFKDAKEKHDDLVCILLSSALSGTYQSAVLAKQMADYERIFLIDSLSASFNIKILADYALDLVAQRKTTEEIVTAVEGMKSKVKVYAALDTLEYLARGGRISKATAAIGQLANIKPIITISEQGEVTLLGKALGKNKAISQILQYLGELEIDSRFPVYAIYSYGTENCEHFQEKLSQTGVSVARQMQIGPTIGTHVGPGAFGIVFVRK